MPVNAPAKVVITPPNSRLSPTLRNVALASARSANSKYAALVPSSGIPMTSVGTLSNETIIFAGVRSLITLAFMESGITSDVNFADGDAHVPSM